MLLFTNDNRFYCQCYRLQLNRILSTGSFILPSVQLFFTVSGQYWNNARTIDCWTALTNRFYCCSFFLFFALSRSLDCYLWANTFRLVSVLFIYLLPSGFYFFHSDINQPFLILKMTIHFLLLKIVLTISFHSCRSFEFCRTKKLKVTKWISRLELHRKVRLEFENELVHWLNVLLSTTCDSGFVDNF